VVNHHTKLKNKRISLGQSSKKKRTPTKNYSNKRTNTRRLSGPRTILSTPKNLNRGKMARMQMINTKKDKKRCHSKNSKLTKIKLKLRIISLRYSLKNKKVKPSPEYSMLYLETSSLSPSLRS
jgi:hypothetical protein